MLKNIKLIAGFIITPIHHQALLDEFGQLFVDKLFDEGKAFFDIDTGQYIIGIEVKDDIYVHGVPMMSAGVCFDYVVRVNKFVGAIDDRLLRTIAAVEGDARNGIWLLHN